ncbi:formyltetrahydrofolate deformylase [Burkholderia lata]|uniref:Formyltetrahydrofolate deformylase n=1 Tax=Burkholderia lata (strain ATCC 17760 / DSM 23089 / LMG 22485 / NCIMB 9086 / R18194 / 383) TaxID=482957 RepID=A0A6P2SY91_BURL3|nr:formyltetrahydrofolate deformylase [Burkholderia lata]VWC51088.1 formyltetrahydrofolate deformylase [Burkholderia lata]
MHSNFVLRFRSPDRPGIMAAVAPLVAAHGCDIRAAEVYGDPDTGHFFCRMELTSPIGMKSLAAHIAPVADRFTFDWELKDLAHKQRVLIAVSRFGHCLIDLIHKQEIGQLPIEIVGVVSNHDTMRKIVEWHGLPYHHLPVDAGKPAQEARFLALIEESGAELTVLARYMQILSDAFSKQLEGRCINIHHSFLPSFKGARPYHQAHTRGVKIIGATAHFVTAELDEGPIIEQDVRRVSHSVTAEEMVAGGCEIEASVLSRAVRWHAEHRIFQNGNKTVVL